MSTILKAANQFRSNCHSCISPKSWQEYSRAVKVNLAAEAEMADAVISSCQNWAQLLEGSKAYFKQFNGNAKERPRGEK